MEFKLPEYHSNEDNKERHNYLLRIKNPLKANRHKFLLSHLAKKKKKSVFIFFSILCQDRFRINCPLLHCHLSSNHIGMTQYKKEGENKCRDAKKEKI